MTVLRERANESNLLPSARFYMRSGIVNLCEAVIKKVSDGSTLRDIIDLPEDMKDAIGVDRLSIQYGGRPTSVKTYHGPISEIRQNGRDTTYRLVYVAKLDEAVYVLHVFTKTSKAGISNPKADTDVTDARFAQALQEHKEFLGLKEKNHER